MFSKYLYYNTLFVKISYQNHSEEASKILSKFLIFKATTFLHEFWIPIPVHQSKRRPCTFGQSLWYTNCSVNFLIFCLTKKKFGQPKKNFGIPKRNLVYQKFPETDQKFPETGQFFFGQPKKMRKRPDNWSTKRLTKTTWTGLICLENK